MKALVIDDEYAIRLSLSHFLAGRGYQVVEAATGSQGLTIARAIHPEIVFLDERLPDMRGEDILQVIASPEIGSSVVMMTAYVEIDKAVQAMRKGAEYYFSKPMDLEQMAVILTRLEEKLALKEKADHYRRLNDLRCGDESIIGESPQIIKTQRLISLLAQNVTTPVLILGESGTGKELVARAIHAASGLQGPLVEINCASLSESMLESELFGHERGAFTDAREKKPGLFEIAADGTIFFDEIGEMSMAVQAKLLKVLDAKTFRRLGGVTDIRSNARVMAATNRELPLMVKKGMFREDLLYRINVLPIHLAPLRERDGDVILLADFFAKRIGEEMGKGRGTISADAMSCLQRYRWPGNVRELKNVIERALILASGQQITTEHLPAELGSHPASGPLAFESVILRPLSQVEEEHIAQVLQITGHNHSRTAAILGISRSTLLARLKRFNPHVRKPDVS